MKTLSRISIILGLLIVSSAHADYSRYDYSNESRWSKSSPIDARQYRQQRRIENARARGLLTRVELKKLNAQQRKIAFLEHRFTRDGHLSHRDLRILHAKLDRASAEISAFEHNDRFRRRGYGNNHFDRSDYLAGDEHRWQW